MGRVRKGNKKKEEEEEDVQVEEEEDNDTLPDSVKNKAKVIFGHKRLESIGWKDLKQVVIKEPSTGEGEEGDDDDDDEESVFLVDGRNNIEDEGPWVFEVMMMEEERRSWFVGNHVLCDGNLYVITPLDPLFLVLPTLMKCSKAMPLRDHLMEYINDVKVLELMVKRLEDSVQMNNIATKVVCDDIIAFKYSEEKTLNWLKKKVERTIEFLKARNITASEAAVSSNFVRSETKNTEEYKQYACEIISGYLDEGLSQKLYKVFGITLILENSKRKTETELEMDARNAKKQKVIDAENGVAPTEDYGSSAPVAASNPNAKQSAKEKELQKAAKGTHSLFKFFAPKAK